MSQYRNADHEALAIVNKHPELFSKLQSCNIVQLRALAAELEAKPKPKASKPKDPYEGWSTAQLVAEGQRLAAEGMQIARGAGATTTGESRAEYEARQDDLDRKMGVPGSRYGADAVSTVQVNGAIQSFGVKVPRGGR